MPLHLYSHSRFTPALNSAEPAKTAATARPANVSPDSDSRASVSTVRTANTKTDQALRQRIAIKSVRPDAPATPADPGQTTAAHNESTPRQRTGLLTRIQNLFRFYTVPSQPNTPTPDINRQSSYLKPDMHDCKAEALFSTTLIGGLALLIAGGITLNPLMIGGGLVLAMASLTRLKHLYHIQPNE